MSEQIKTSEIKHAVRIPTTKGIRKGTLIPVYSTDCGWMRPEFWDRQFLVRQICGPYHLKVDLV